MCNNYLSYVVRALQTKQVQSITSDVLTVLLAKPTWFTPDINETHSLFLFQIGHRSGVFFKYNRSLPMFWQCYSQIPHDTHQTSMKLTFSFPNRPPFRYLPPNARRCYHVSNNFQRVALSALLFAHSLFLLRVIVWGR